MLKNYLKIAWRSINRYKAYNFINIAGLALGLASFLIILVIVRYELSYDSFHSKASRTYRVTLNANGFNPNVSMAVIPAIRNDFPELEQASQVCYQQDGFVKVGQSRFTESSFAFVDENFTGIFDYQWVTGNPQSALSTPNSIVLTESIARKYFGSKEAIGQVINVNNKFDAKVTGLIRDLPGNTHLPFSFLISFATVRQNLQNAMSSFYWIMNGSFAYVVVPENYPVQQLEKRMPAFIQKNWGENIAKEAKLLLQPLQDIHFDQRYLHNTISPTTSRETYWALAIVAVFIILIASINFINLATAQAIRRAKEVGIRKVLGSNRRQLIWQFLGETTMLVLTALILALTITTLFLPLVTNWLDIKIDSAQLADPLIVGLLVVTTVLVILLAGLYPAFVQSAFRPVTSLKTKTSVSFKGLILRKGLVGLQFIISQILIIGTLVVAYQMNFFRNQDLGFNKEAVLSFDIPSPLKRESLSQQLISVPGIKEVSYSSGAPAYGNMFTAFSSPELGITKADVTEMKFVDEKYIDMFDIKLLAGNTITRNSKTGEDTVYNIVANETMVHKLGIQDPQEAIGKHILLNGTDWYCTITGVVKDIQSESKHKKIRPCALLYRADNFNTVSARIHPNGMHETISRIEKTWSSLFPDDNFEYEFLDDHIASFYKQEQKTYTAFRMFSIIAILIGCLGLYGLVAFAAVQRSKEIGIRKVLGAGIVNIISLFGKELAILIVLAFIIAAPVAYHVMNNWLKNFAYQVNIGKEIFLVAIAASFLIAALAIASQAIKAAIANPVKSLRSE